MVWRRGERPLAIDAEADVERDSAAGDPEDPRRKRVTRHWRAEEEVELWVAEELLEAEKREAGKQRAGGKGAAGPHT